MTGQRDLGVRGLTERAAEIGPHDPVYESRLIAGLSFVNFLSGDLVEGRKNAEQLHSLASVSRIAYTQTWGSHMKACTDLHAFDLEGACKHFAECADQRYIFHAMAATDGLAGLALAHQLRGEKQAAEEASHRLDTFTRELQGPLYHSVAASSRARLALLQGDLESAAQWARTVDHVPGPAELFIWLEVPAITQARVLIAMGTSESLARATDLLKKIREGTEAWHFTCQTIEVSVLQVLAQEGQGQTTEAQAALRAALALSRPGGWIRPFVEAGPRVWKMLQALRAQEYEPDFIRRILAATEGAELSPEGADLPQSAPTPPPSSADVSSLPAMVPSGPFEPAASWPSPASLQAAPHSLTNREIDVLELLSQRLRSKEIAARLFISPHTVNDHLKRTYRKLGVSNRRQAVERGIALGVITGPPSRP
jgi:LuxR family maltose regulon positive regulatory protein